MEDAVVTQSTPQMRPSEAYTETTTGLARLAGVAPDTVRVYSNAGCIDHIRLSSGTRLFKPEAAAAVRELCKARIALRGRWKAPTR